MATQTKNVNPEMMVEKEMSFTCQWAKPETVRMIAGKTINAAPMSSPVKNCLARLTLNLPVIAVIDSFRKSWHIIVTRIISAACTGMDTSTDFC